MPTVAAPRHASRLGEARWSVWTTQAHLIVTDVAVLMAAEHLTHEWLAAVDVAASRFRSDSEVRRLAVTGARGEAISPLLAELIRVALDAAALTDGDVDPTLGNALVRLGYPGSGAATASPEPADPIAQQRRCSWSDIRLVGERLWLPEGVLLDLGATAKAHTADLVAQAIARQLGVGVLLSLGGDVRVAGELTPDEGWVVQVQDGPSQPSATVRLAGALALATSSTLHRTWQLGASSLHHVLDPATCRPTPVVWRTATVAADSCLLANTLSTACLVRGLRAPALLTAAGVAGRLVGADGSVYNLGGFPL
jgi:thiamine biosynthesis lipoprotein